MVGGLIMVKLPINRALWLFGLVQIVSILGFAALSVIGSNLWMLGFAVAFEYLGVGLGTAAFVSFIARETDKRYTAFQFALLTSLAGIPAMLLSASAGFIAEALGWPTFFAACTVLALPGLAMLPLVAPWRESAASAGATPGQ